MKLTKFQKRLAGAIAGYCFTNRLRSYQSPGDSMLHIYLHKSGYLVRHNPTVRVCCDSNDCALKFEEDEQFYFTGSDLHEIISQIDNAFILLSLSEKVT